MYSNPADSHGSHSVLPGFESPTEGRTDVPRDGSSHHSGGGNSQFPALQEKAGSAASSSSQLGLAKENEGVKSLKEDPNNLQDWDSLHYKVFKLWTSFGTWNSRQILKNIGASPQVLRTYHDSFLFGTVPLSVRARALLRTGFIGSVWNLAEFALALLSGVLYVLSTYRPEIHENWGFRCQNVISIVFIADYVLRIYCEPVRLYFIFSFWGIVDLLSCVPVILVFRRHIHGRNLLRLLEFLRTIRVFHLTNKIGTIGSSVSQQITLLTIATFGVIFLDAGLLQWVEYYLASPEKRSAENCTEQGCLTFWESVYFLVVTVSTVGYGDISPTTMIGQLIAIVTIVGALTILPIQISRITSLAYRRPYGGSFRSSKIVGSRFLILSGSISITAVQNFLAEFYNPTHCEDLEVYPLRVIILAPFSPSFELKQILYLYNGLVEFIEGSPVRQSDLARVSAEKAAAFFILADSEASDIAVEDAAQVVRALAVHRYCLPANSYRRRVRIIVEVLDPETHNSSVWDESLTGGIEVICPVKVHYKMMARSCAVQGLYTLITNLFTSELQLKYLNKQHFLTEYFHSFDNEVYPVIMPAAFHGRPFEEVAEFIFSTYHAVLFAVDATVGFKPDGQPDRKALLFPKGHCFHSDDVGMIISPDLHTAYSISTYRPGGDKANCLKELWTLATNKPSIRRDNEGTELLDPASGKWKRTSSSAFRPAPRSVSLGPRNPAFGEEGSGSYPTSPDSQRGLEHKLRLQIRGVYSSEELPEWGQTQHRTGEAQQADGQDLETAKPESDKRAKAGQNEESPSDSKYRFSRGISLEKAAQDLLAWPPILLTDRPHPAVIEERQDVIAKDLKARTINMVAFSSPHILVCCQTGWPVHFFHFLLEIRRPELPRHPPVVMMHPNSITPTQWGSVGVFKDVYFLKGSPIYELDLLRGGVLQAEKIVVLSNEGTPVDLRGGKEGDDKKYLKRSPSAYTSDVDNIVVAANVQRLYGHNRCGNVMVEMLHTEAFHYLRPQYAISRSHFSKEGYRRNQDALVHFGPPFMEGKAVSASMLAFLMRSSFYNRNTQSLVDQMIQGGFAQLDDESGTERPKILDQVALPEEYANKPYSELFHGFLRNQGILAIGLYRVQGNLGAPTSYVLTNPEPKTVVNPGDLVYVLY